jgi:c(7)-type cytochrome triheme protein
MRAHVVAACALAFSAASAAAGDWLPLAKDGVHDPRSPALELLQEPREALSRLAPDHAGNQVRWVEALDKGQIDPRTNILPDTKIQVLDLDVLLNLRGGTPIVRFPHRQHTLWLDCSNCHEHLFKSKAGANKLSMMQILQGEQCGVCHGAVSFPLTECTRCHSVPRTAAVQPKRP